ncbi:hypothetical protein Tco_0665320 [Tanacetum coccineum]
MILFGAIPAIIPDIPEVPIVSADPIVTPEVGTVSVVSHAEVLDLVDYSPSSDFDLSEDSLPPTPYLPLVLPFLCSDDTEADGESEPAKQRLVSSSHDTLAPLSEFPLALVISLPKIRRHSATLIRPGEAIPFGRPYRTHPNGPLKLLTARKRVRPISTHRLAWRRVSHHSSDRHSSTDSSSSSVPSDHSLSGHTPPDTTDADSSTPQRFVHRSLARTPRHSEAFRRWRSAPLSTPYPPTTSESSLGSSSERSLDSSSPSSRPSRKRCRSPTASVPSPTHVSRSIAPTPADLLPPRKRFRDSYSPEDSGEEHMEVDTADAEAVADVGISEGVVAHPEDGVGMGFEIAASDVREDDEERRNDEDKDKEPSAGSNRGSKRRRTGKEPESTSTPKEKTTKSTGKSTKGSKSFHKSAGESTHAEEPMHIAKDLEEPAHQELLSPDRNWNKTLPTDHGQVQPWLSNLAREEGPRVSFDELMDTPLDFLAFMMSWLKVDTLTPELLTGRTFKLMRGTCKSLVELEYFFEEVYKATTDQLIENNS